MAVKTDQVETSRFSSRPLRSVLRWLAKAAFWLLTDLTIEGEENFPESGPLIMVGNHFGFVDPAAFVRIAPWPLDFLGGAIFPHAPKILHFIPRLWGYISVHRGSSSGDALREGVQILKRGGVVGIFPEAGSWAQYLRLARPGAAYLSALSGAPLLPVGLVNMTKVFPSLRKFKRQKITIRIGKTFGPLHFNSKGKPSRKLLDDFGHEIMRCIAALIPSKQGGIYSSDPKVREAAKGTERYPWEGVREGVDEYKAP